MNRTTIMLDEELKARVVMRAREQGVSLGAMDTNRHRP